MTVSSQEKQSILTISEAAETVHGWHLDDKSEDIVDESVEEFVAHHTPWQMGNGLEFVVDEQLRCHHDEAEGKQEAIEHGQHPRVPSLVLFVQQ